jgi:rSAM/selenodomain-associated transferase 2
MPEHIRYTVIIPTLNEEAHIAACVADLRGLQPAAEIIVADGGSNDATALRAAQAGALVVPAARGRGPQCNAGAALARGDVLIFLHADTRLPRNAFALLDQFFADPQVQVAKFRLSFDKRDWLLDLAAWMMWVDSIWSSFGDQGIVVRRSFFETVNGFPDWPLYEDVRFFEYARNRSHVYVVPAEVVTSARRFRSNGVLRQLFRDVLRMSSYLLGRTPDQIATGYEREGGGAADRGASPT